MRAGRDAALGVLLGFCVVSGAIAQTQSPTVACPRDLEAAKAAQDLEAASARLKLGEFEAADADLRDAIERFGPVFYGDSQYLFSDDTSLHLDLADSYGRRGSPKASAGLRSGVLKARLERYSEIRAKGFCPTRGP